MRGSAVLGDVARARERMRIEEAGASGLDGARFSAGSGEHEADRPISRQPPFRFKNSRLGVCGCRNSPLPFLSVVRALPLCLQSCP